MKDNKNKVSQKLYCNEVDKNEYPSDEQYQDHLLEQYQLYVESTDRISARRQTTNSFFVTINTALVALVGYVQVGHDPKTVDQYFWLIAFAGVAISYMWYRLIRSYRDLNNAKFKVIHEIEKSLPVSPYDAEWEAVGRGEDSNIYLPFTNIEVGIPWVFLVLHLAIFLRSFPWRTMVF